MLTAFVSLSTWCYKVFEIDDVKAWKSVLISVSSYALGLFMISKAPWYLLPLAWAWTGTAVTGVSYLDFFYCVGLWCYFKMCWVYIFANLYFVFASHFLVLCYRPWLCPQIIFEEQVTGRHCRNSGLSATDIPIRTLAV